mmetsp:Transcript_38672/g.76124  ORF Transcript_38672/g.76124 Transcript_38672/m.76124 type:complete len:200 (+) Transcript_38672:20-619(+)
MLFLLMFLSFDHTAAKCYCPYSICNQYSGTEQQCNCWAEQTANTLGVGGKVTYFPHSTFSSGGCTFCTSSGQPQQELSTEESVSHNSTVVTTSVASNTTIKTNTSEFGTTSDNGGFIFPITVGVCANGCHRDAVSGFPTCNLYVGSYATCTQWCKTQAMSLKVLSGNYKCSYLPNGAFSTGSCSISASIDPCGPVPPGC